MGLAPPGRSMLLVRCLLQHPPAAVLKDALWDALCQPCSLSKGSPTPRVCPSHPRCSGWVSPSSWYPCHSHPSPSPRTFQYVPPKATGLGKQGPPPFPAQLPLRPSAAHAPGHAIVHNLLYLLIKKPPTEPPLFGAYSFSPALL